jgi:acetoin utilization deacetylase AcuC-like enzyme
VHVVGSPRYHIDIGPHIFPTAKYQELFRQLSVESRWDWIEPEPASWEQLGRVHTAEYLAKARDGGFTAEEIRELELPWSRELVEGFRLMTGGTIAAARLAADEGLGIHAGGGFHHAFANHGEGFCLFNDIAVAIRVLQVEQRASRAAVVDLDVHHGNGTSMIFDGDESVFTFSMHQQHNYPMFKPRSSLDIGLADGTGGGEYNGKLRRALPTVLASRPDVIFYLAGADPFQHDQLGGLAMTRDDLLERDRMVFDACRSANVPIVVTLAGGYAQRLTDTVEIHRATIEAAREVFTAGSLRRPS